jgi:hypothetical protein
VTQWHVNDASERVLSVVLSSQLECMADREASIDYEVPVFKCYFNRR